MMKQKNTKRRVITLAKTHERTLEKWLLLGMAAVSVGLYCLTNWLISHNF